MMGRTKIEWCERTWNPVVGCTRVSEGCRHCYAERMARRLAAMGKPAYETAIQGKRWSGAIASNTFEVWNEPLRARKPTVWFVGSMSDLFHPGVSYGALASVFWLMWRARRHRFLLLTKRPLRMRDVLRDERFWATVVDQGGGHFSETWPWAHVGLGVSAEDADAWAARVPVLVDTPAAMRFVSAEPLLGMIPAPSLRHIDWVIAGGESGPGARPMHPRWVRLLRGACVAASVPFFFKQWGEWAPDCFAGVACRTTPRPAPGPKGVMFRCGKKTAGAMLDGREWRYRPEWFFAG